MQIYLHKNNQQLGPFDGERVLEWLKAGQLSPGDMAVRQGESQWRNLGAIFPGVASGAGNPPLSADLSNQKTNAPGAGKTAKSILRALLFSLGTLLFLGGSGGTLYSFVLSYNANFHCDSADRAHERIQVLRRESSPENNKLLDSALTGAERAQKECDERKSVIAVVRFLMVPVAFIGFFMIIGSLFAKGKKIGSKEK